MSKVILVTGGTVAARAMTGTLINRLEADIVTCEPEDHTIYFKAYDLTPVQDVCITDEEYYGKRNKKGKLKKDWQL